MDLFEELSGLGANVNDAVERFLGNRALYEKMLKKFPGVIEDRPVMSFIEAGDYTTASANAHALKGVVGDLSLIPLFEKYSEIMKLFRSGKNEEAKAYMQEILVVQQTFIDCIKKYI